MLPDALTELDFLAPPQLDPSLLFAEPTANDTAMDDFNLPSQSDLQLSMPTEQPREVEENLPLDLEDDLGLDFGEGPTIANDTSIEIGRDAPAPRRASEEFAESPKLLDDAGLDLDFGDGPLDDTTHIPRDDAIDIGDLDDIPIEGGDAGAALEANHEREDSPLSVIRPSVERDLEQTFNLDESTAHEEELIQQTHRAKKRKVLQADADTEIHSSQIRAQQTDRSQILKPTSFLPRDPVLLALMNLQKSGGFVSSILGDGRMLGMAPELRGIMSLEVVRGSGNLKRKRDSGVADLEEADEDEQVGDEQRPQLEIDQDEFDLGMDGGAVGGDTMIGAEMEELPPLDDDQPIADNFDETTVPLVHPADSGPIAVDTKHAVHRLRERFGAGSADSPSQRQKSAVVFQEMLPESRTSRSEATKMFFEILVLATKDAIKVEQPTDGLGKPMKIRSKRGLWGSWAEAQAGGEIAAQGTQMSSIVASL